MSFRKPLNLMLIYAIPFTLILLLIIGLLSFWSLKKHKEEQIKEFTETGRALASHIERTVTGKGSGILQYSSLSSNENISVSIIDIKSSVLKIWNKDAQPAEGYIFIDSPRGRIFNYQRVVDTDRDTPQVISIRLPASVSDLVHSDKIKRDIISFITIGAISLLFLFFTLWKLSKRISRGINTELEEERLKALIELAGATAHEMRQPLAIIIGYSELLSDSVKRGKPADEEISVIKNQCYRMDEIIKKMLNITHYRTIEYTDGIRILDLHAQGSNRCLN